MITRPCLAIGVVGLLTLLSEGCVNSPVDPSVPTRTAPSIQAVVIQGVAPTLAPGQTMQLTALAAFGDGSTKDVTARVVWQSSDRNVATVSLSGFLTIVKFGKAEMSATLEGITGLAQVLIEEPIRVPSSEIPSYEITGIVHESAPTQNVVLANARVEVVGGPLAGQVFAVDAQGRFRLPPVTTAGFALKFKSGGYEDFQADIVQLPRDEHLDVSLPPTLAILHEDLSGSFPSPCYSGTTRDFTFPVHHTGPFMLESVVSPSGSSVRLFRGPNIMPWLYEGEPVPLSGGEWYRLVVACESGGKFQVRFSRPN